MRGRFTFTVSYISVNAMVITIPIKLLQHNTYVKCTSESFWNLNILSLEMREQVILEKQSTSCCFLWTNWLIGNI